MNVNNKRNNHGQVAENLNIGKTICKIMETPNESRISQ